jgi:hypothetical protein
MSKMQNMNQKFKLFICENLYINHKRDEVKERRCFCFLSFIITPKSWEWTGLGCKCNTKSIRDRSRASSALPVRFKKSN